MLLLQGNGPAARDELRARRRPGPVGAREAPAPARARPRLPDALAQARAGRSPSAMRAAARRASTPKLHAGPRRRTAAARAQAARCCALALQRAGRHRRGHRRAAAVLETASQEGFMRLILDEGPGRRAAGCGTSRTRCDAAPRARQQRPDPRRVRAAAAAGVTGPIAAARWRRRRGAPNARAPTP